MSQLALIRDISPSVGDCELSFVDRVAIDPDLARRQHQAYARALESLGCTVRLLPAQPDMPDAVFVEDTALVLDELAVCTRPGVESRRREVPSMAEVLAGYRKLEFISAPGTLEGGDILRIGRRIYVGLSARSNPEGIRQLEQFVRAHGYHVEAVPIRGCLHLKSAVTGVDGETVLLQRDWVDPASFKNFRHIAIDEREPHAANALRVDAGLVYPDCFPRTLERLRRSDVLVTTVDVSELQKAEGAVTCCTLLLQEA